MRRRCYGVVAWIVCLLFAGPGAVRAAPQGVSAPAVSPMQAAGSPCSDVISFDGPRYDNPFTTTTTLDLYGGSTGVKRFNDILDAYIYVGTFLPSSLIDPESLGTAAVDDGPCYSTVFSGASPVAPPPASGVRTSSGVRQPRVLQAIGSLRPGSTAPDLVVVSPTPKKVYVYLAQGDGVLTPPTSFTLTTGGIFQSVAIGDTSGDGKPDLVFSDTTNNRVVVLPGNGDGTFGTATSISLGPTNVSAATVAVGDVNGDGKADIVTGNVGSVTVLLNNGSGGFGSPATYAAPVTANCSGGGGCGATIALGDLNGDGKADIVTTTTSAPNAAQVAVVLNNGTGTFGTATLYAVGNGPGAIAIGDANGDNRPDLAVANTLDHTASVLLNTGGGAFAAQVAYPVGKQPQTLALADQNRDGIADLVSVGADSSRLILHGKGDGTFPRLALTVGSQPQDVIAPVLTASGRRDLVSVGYDNAVTVLLNAGGGTFAAAPGSPVALPTRCWSIAASDFTGDGMTDLALTCNDGVRILTGNGAGGFAVGSPLAAAGNNALGYRIVAVDVGNGHPDLIVNGAGELRVLLNNGSGTFTNAPGSPLMLGAATDTDALAVADTNGDSKPDLLVALAPAGMQGGQVAVLLGNGDGTFAAAPGSPIGAGVASPAVAAADVNGDGKPDLVTLVAPDGATSTSRTAANVRLGLGNGTFGAPTTLPDPFGGSGNHPYKGLAVADLDGDGAMDVAVATQCNGVGAVALFRNAGDGTFIGAGVRSYGQGATNDPGVLRAANLSGSYPDLVAPTTTVTTDAFNPIGTVSVLRNRTIPPSAATRLIVAPGADAIATGKPFAVAVAAVDATGQIVTGYRGPVTLSLGGGSGLGGTLTQRAAGGTAIFLGLTVAAPGTGLTLTAAGGVLAGTSPPFTVTGAMPTPDPRPPPRPTFPPQLTQPVVPPARRPEATSSAGTPTPLPRPAPR